MNIIPFGLESLAYTDSGAEVKASLTNFLLCDVMIFIAFLLITEYVKIIKIALCKEIRIFAFNLISNYPTALAVIPYYHWWDTPNLSRKPSSWEPTKYTFNTLIPLDYFLELLFGTSLSQM